jgi:hypothetical protein
MPSPFPGMDPFIEGQEWPDFHYRFNTSLSDLLCPAVGSQYAVRIEHREYQEGRWDDCREYPVNRLKPVTLAAPVALETGGVLTKCLLPMPVDWREAYLVIRDPLTGETVTIVETLSPANKRTSSDGREQYLRLRCDILQTHCNLVELDLLRGGMRPPVYDRASGDYFAIVSRSYRRPLADLYHWPLLHRLPIIPIPLKKGEPEAQLDLQQVFNRVYELARYHRTLDYTAPLSTPLDERTSQWLRERLAHNGHQAT